MNCDRCELSRCCVMCCDIIDPSICTTSCDKEMTSEFMKLIIETRAFREKTAKNIEEYYKELM